MARVDALTGRDYEAINELMAISIPFNIELDKRIRNDAAFRHLIPQYQYRLDEVRKEEAARITAINAKNRAAPATRRNPEVRLGFTSIFVDSLAWSVALALLSMPAGFILYVGKYGEQIQHDMHWGSGSHGGATFGEMGAALLPPCLAGLLLGLVAFPIVYVVVLVIGLIVRVFIQLERRASL